MVRPPNTGRRGGRPFPDQVVGEITDSQNNSASRLADRLEVDPATASQAYYACLLSNVGCTTDAHSSARCPSRRARRPCVPFRSRADSRGSSGCSVRISPPCARWRDAGRRGRTARLDRGSARPARLDGRVERERSERGNMAVAMMVDNPRLAGHPRPDQRATRLATARRGSCTFAGPSPNGGWRVSRRGDDEPRDCRH